MPLVPCAALVHPLDGDPPGWLMDGPLPAVEEEEGSRVPADLPPITDAHVHLFPEPLFDALWRWFDAHAWPVRYKLYAERVLAFLQARGVERVVGLQYAHRPGMAASLNAFMADLQRRHPFLVGMATALPGAEETPEVLREAFDVHGLRGVKVHCHVQCFAPDDAGVGPIAQACSDRGLPLIMHAGREPKSPAYACDPHALCAVGRVERLLLDFPRLKLVVPHLGADEFHGYTDLLERYDHLWLDTTMALADYFPDPPPRRMLEVRPDRILYGTDFPNLPYPWDRELLRLRGMGLGDDVLQGILGGNAAAVYGTG